LAIFRDGLWAVLQSPNNLPRYQQFGQGSDIPVPGDYNGDSRTDFAVWRQGVFYVAPVVRVVKWQLEDGSFYKQEWNNQISRMINSSRRFQSQEVRAAAQRLLNLKI